MLKFADFLIYMNFTMNDNSSQEEGSPMEEISVLVGRQIRTYRKQRKMTQKDLAAAAGTSTGSISKWEAGAQPRAYMLPRLAKALGVSVAELRG